MDDDTGNHANGFPPRTTDDQIIDLLKNEPMNVNKLASETGYTVRYTSVRLRALTKKGIIIKSQDILSGDGRKCIYMVNVGGEGNDISSDG